MDLLRNLVLTLIVFLPLVGTIVVMFMPKENERGIKRFATWWSLLPLALSIFLAVDYWVGFVARGAGDMAYEVKLPWIPALDVHYHIGADGLSAEGEQPVRRLKEVGVQIAFYEVRRWTLATRRRGLTGPRDLPRRWVDEGDAHATRSLEPDPRGAQRPEKTPEFPLLTPRRSSRPARRTQPRPKRTRACPRCPAW